MDGVWPTKYHFDALYTNTIMSLLNIGLKLLWKTKCIVSITKVCPEITKQPSTLQMIYQMFHNRGGKAGKKYILTWHLALKLAVCKNLNEYLFVCVPLRIVNKANIPTGMNKLSGRANFQGSVMNTAGIFHFRCRLKDLQGEIKKYIDII